MTIDWSSAPEWAEFHAFDKDGRGYWYKSRPTLDPCADYWYVPGCHQKGEYYVEQSGHYVGMPSTYYDRSLVSRPIKGCQNNEIAELKSKVAELDRQVIALKNALKSRDLVLSALRVRLDQIQEREQWQDYLKAKGDK